jgi:Protein of unknown function (DUF1573)
MKLPSLLAFISLSVLFSGSAGAALTWDTKEVELHPKLNDKTAVAHFKFKNTGDKPVKILSVHPSCGCTTAALAHDVIAPNESGEITATFNIGGRTGKQKKMITVNTDDQPDEATILALTADIPQLLQISPIFVYWSAKDTLDPKTITITVGPDYPVEKLTVTSTDKSISTEVKPGADKKTFQLIVKPTESGRPINASLKIEPDYPKDSPPKPYFANVRVDSRAAKPSPGPKSAQTSP